jgi:hypothetical protein
VTNPPAGWPNDLVSAHDPEFAGQVSRWVLERLPSEFRATAITRDPVAAAWVLQERVRSDIELMRRLYATARTSSGSAAPADVLESLSQVGAQLLRAEREVNCVVSALTALDHDRSNTSDLD